MEDEPRASLFLRERRGDPPADDRFTSSSVSLCGLNGLCVFTDHKGAQFSVHEQERFAGELHVGHQ